MLLVYPPAGSKEISMTIIARTFAGLIAGVLAAVVAAGAYAEATRVPDQP
jgi:uncharacterized membrane protein YagU involved in acid resistance